ncbi:MAG: hypothetical protein H7Z12_10490 [Rhodospirillaceae bacterium]|nr:hypothetical protein [Rhodospirillales bacterium]
MRAYHLHQLLTKHPSEIVQECRGPAARGWAPAQTALATAILYTPPYEASEGMELLRKAATADEPLAVSLYGGELGGEEGRRFVKRGAELGIVRGAGGLALKSGSASATEQDNEDVYWASYILDQVSPIKFKETRSQYETGRDALPLDVRQRLEADAKSTLVGPAAPTPVSPQVEYDIKADLYEKYPKTKASRMLAPYGYPRIEANPINRAFAHVLLEDPVVVEAVRTHFAPKASP